eukprot:scaffold43_cov115-Pinguiococcus_pyrenoidosus.AAC.1
MQGVSALLPSPPPRVDELYRLSAADVAEEDDDVETSSRDQEYAQQRKIPLLLDSLSARPTSRASPDSDKVESEAE